MAEQVTWRKIMAAEGQIYN